MASIARIRVRGIGPEIPRTTWANMPPQLMLMTLVEIEDSDGAVGYGMAQSYGAGQYDHSNFESIRPLLQFIIGKEAANIEARWHDLHTVITPATPGTVAAVDIALWDLAAKKAGLPLYRYLGGARDEMPAYASTAQLDTVNDYLKHLEEMADEGFTAVKFHAWNVPERDLEMLRAAHREFGDTLTLMHDAENRYDYWGALRVGRELSDMNFRWFEAPFKDYDLNSYRRLRERIDVPIVPHGLWLLDLQEFYTYAAQGPWDAVRFDATMSGGISQARKLVALADCLGLPAEQQSWGYSFIQAAALHIGLSNLSSSYFESPVPYEAYEYGILNPIRVGKDGMVRPPSGNGLGLDIDWPAMDAATLVSYETTSSTAVAA
ncbi:mandelate racemase/muconate lactonizing enzyme family protein [Saccharopolyspora spinosa]|uniref:L-alanine-DL-glutamate epimerase-like enolase superfamily enzyme n=1 Tax=Saccharopolyspora spinosa TaxID=60894 RepID=A0A2N3Y0R1_SACSN|nr:mandelate racemase/muconate lactonizing enzyme family protein [Saccharopolyspora spinosa]PKW16483.1 L-alanine-DL-glutamate epimerase-like enolase superfamily enzyme [Saccharopolyspora spinosa]